MQNLSRLLLIAFLSIPLAHGQTFGTDASKFSISFQGDEFLVHGEKVDLSITHPEGASATVIWEQSINGAKASEIGRGNLLQFTAPAQGDSCEDQHVKVTAKITTEKNSSDRSVTFTVVNPICNMARISGLLNPSCTRIAVRNNLVAVGTDRGLSIYDGTGWTSFQRAGKKRPLGEISALAWEDNGTLWVGNSVTNYIPFPVVIGLGVERLRKGHIWENNEISSKTGLEGMLAQFVRFDDPYTIIGTKSDLNSGALFASGGITLGSDTFNATQVILSNADVYSTAKDKDGERWYGTKNGVYVFKGDALTHVYDGREWHGKGRVYSNTSVKAMVKDHDTMWLGLEGGYFGGGGLVRYANGTWSEPQHLPANASDDIRSMTIDNHGNLWIGTARGLVLRRGADATFSVFTEQDGLGSLDIRDIAFDASRNILWVATANGLTRINLNLFGLKAH